MAKRKAEGGAAAAADHVVNTESYWDDRDADYDAEVFISCEHHAARPDFFIS